MKTFTPLIYNISNPIGFDLEIAAIQSKLACNTWMEVIYGKAIRQKRQMSENESQNLFNPNRGLRGPAAFNIFYPQGRVLGSDKDFSFDDSIATSCFFFSHDPINANPKADPHDWTSGVEIAQPFSLIFFANLDKLGTDNSEILKTGILFQLNRCPKLVITTLYENVEKVWSDFDITTRIAEFSKFPYYCLKVECIVTYQAFPFNYNGAFDPNTYNNDDNSAISPNTTNNYPNTN